MTLPDQSYLKRFRRILFAVIIFSLLVFSVVSFILSFFFLDAYRSFEENEMQSRMERFSDNLNNAIRNIERTVYDYSFWDDMALYSEGIYPDFPGQGMSSSSFMAIGMDFVGIFDREGKQLYGEDYTHPLNGSYPVRSELAPYLTPKSPLLQGTSASDTVFPSIIFHHGNLSGVLVSHPIFYHTTGIPGNGHVVMGRYFQGPLIEELSVFFKHPVQLPNPDEIGPIPEHHRDLNQDRVIFVQVLNETRISGFLKIPDPVTGENTIFQVTYPRDLYQEGISTLSSYLLLILGIICVFSILTLVGIRFYLRHADTSARLAREKDYSYQRIIEEIEDAYFKATPDGIIEQVGPGTLKMLGYSDPSELVGQPLSVLYLNPDDRATLRRILFTERQLKNHPLVLKRKDGSLVFITTNVHLVFDETGTVTGIEGIAHDNTGMVLAKRASDESDSFYRLIFESTNIGLFQNTLEGGFSLVNPALAEMFGYDGPQQMQEEVKSIIHDLGLSPEDKNRLLDDLNTKGAVRNAELCLRKRDGSSIWLNCNIVSIKDVNEQMVAFFGTALDISEKKRIELELIESQRKFKSLFYFSPIAILVYDREGMLVDLNSEAISLFGSSKRSIPESCPLFQSAFLTLEQKEDLRSGQVVRAEVRMDLDLLRSAYDIPPTRSGIMYLEVLITPVPQSDQTIGWYLVQIEDITNIKLSELALRESEHKYREVFSNVSLGLILFEFTKEGEPGRIIDANPRALEMVGMSLPDIHDQDIPIRAFLPISGSSMVRELTVIDTDICTFESGIIRNVDDILPVQVTLDIFRLEDNVVGLAIIEDITQKRQYEEERYRLIEQIEKNLAELSILNDGVRNPLTIIMMIVEELDETISGPVIRQIRIIDDLINQLDKRWIESDKILQYLQKYHHIRYKL